MANPPWDFLKLSRIVGFALLFSGPILMAVSTVIMSVPQETSTCAPTEGGEVICFASTGPGPLRPAAGGLFLAGLLVPGVGLLVLAPVAGGPVARAAFLVGGASLLASVTAGVAFYLLVTRL